jgi:Rieske Fe-S protein
MNRKNFIMTCGVACLGGTVLSSFLQSCTGIKILTRDIVGSDLIVPISDFEINEDNQRSFKRYILVQNDQLQYPICVYRFSEDEYAALWMRCTHQGTELQVFGGKLQCPAHGSEFSNRGEVRNGPADKPLRTLSVRKETGQLKISLK